MSRQNADYRRLSGAEKRALLASLLRDRAELPTAVHGLSHGQKALWLLHRRDPQNPAYNTALSLRVRSEIEAAVVQDALQEIVKRHTALRTTFPYEGNRPVAVVHASSAVVLLLVDAREWNEDDVYRAAAEDYRKPFDLERGPLLRASLYTRHKDDHVLLITVHHIVCDTWSLWLLLHEFGILYSSAVAGQDADLPPVGTQYADFVRWQGEIVGGAEGERLWKFWQGALFGTLPILNLPTRGPRPAALTTRGASHFFTLEDGLVRGLADIGKAEGATLFVCLLAMFQTLLHRYTGQEDIIVGSPISGRSHPDTATVIGYFANPLPLRGDLSGDPTVRELITRLRDTVAGALSHQDMPFSLLVEKLHPKRDPSRSPVIEAMLVMQSPPSNPEIRGLIARDNAEPVRVGELLLEPFILPLAEGQFDLTLEIVEGRSIAAAIKYNPDLFDAAMIERMGGHLKTLIEAAVSDAGQRISKLPLLPVGERKRVLLDWQGPKVAYSLNRCVHHWIEDLAERTPDKIAVVMADVGGGELSFGELNAQANRLARHLLKLGVSRDAAVGILAERSLEMVIALLAVLKAGAAFVPLDPDYPQQRLTTMVETAEIVVLVANRFLSNRLGIVPCPIVRLEDDGALIRLQSSFNPNVEVDSSDLAYVMFTSGSTGQPKGVENTHRGISNRLLWMQEAFPLDGSDRVLQKTPFSFDVSVWEFFWPLMTGATLVMARPGGHRDAEYLRETVVAQRITTLHFVPSMLQVFLDSKSTRHCHTSLRRVICSGEALPFKLQQRFFERLEQVELHNLYGPTEAAIDVTHWRCEQGSVTSAVPIGRPIANTQTYLLDRNLQPVPIGVVGELYIGGIQVAKGYRNRPELTAEKFLVVFLAGRESERVYRTGDMCRWLPDGNLEYVGRIDQQIKLRGFRIEPGEIEAALLMHPQVKETVLTLDESGAHARLLAWLVAQSSSATCSDGELRHFLRASLPEYMIPASFTWLASLPLTSSGKVDRAALAPAKSVVSEEGSVTQAGAVEQRVAEIWRGALSVENVGRDVNFFDVGGHSLLLAEVQMRLAECFGKAPSMVEMFQFTTIRALAGFYAHEHEAPLPPRVVERPRKECGRQSADIAIVGMAGRFPGASDVPTLWRNLCEGIEAITVFDAEQSAASGADPALLKDPNYVPAYGALADVDLFDAEFFGFSPREAELTDVQHRLLLECASAALEDAGHAPQMEGRRYGMFAGVGMNRYLLNNIVPHHDLVRSADHYQLMLGNDKDFAPTRISYKLGLEGPSISVQTACSTSLVAVHLACRSLLARECDGALAGGCSVALPQDRGYLYQKGMILSPDGHCRAFDAKAQGTVGGNGVALVVLRRLEDALADGDDIYAVIKGSAINNDGSGKAGFTAPSASGQAAVISAALAEAAVPPDTIGYVEAHGTGTAIGDPIEISALNRAFRASTQRSGYCAIGSVKTNLGHLDSAAGVTGLIKAALTVKHGQVPPSLHYSEANPALELERTPFFVQTQLASWPNTDTPRRAGVSSFGIGGTNAHVVLEQPPETISGPGRPVQLLVLSAKDKPALDLASVGLAAHLRAYPRLDLGDVAFTLARGRHAYGFRRMLVCRTSDEAVEQISALPRDRQGSSSDHPASCSVAFMFPGQGSQYLNMAAEIYREEPIFRAEVDRCALLLRVHLGRDLREILYPSDDTPAEQDALTQTEMAQPVLFVVEYAMAHLWMSWGVRPNALIGHSLGEYVAACLAGVWSLADALAIVALRARLMQQQPVGGMLAIRLPETEVRALLTAELSMAAVNAPGHCVVAGPHEAILALTKDLIRRDIACQPLKTSHAFHSAMMEPVREGFAEHLRAIKFHPPSIPFISNVTGTWIEPNQVTNPEYWIEHLLSTVLFAKGLDTLLQKADRCLIEIGPGDALASFARRHPRHTATQAVLTSICRRREQVSDLAYLLQTVGHLWVAGATIDWEGFYAGQQRKRLHLPTYPFRRQRYWIDPPKDNAVAAKPIVTGKRPSDEWFYLPSWQRTSPPRGETVAGTHWVLLMDGYGIGEALAARLLQNGITVSRVFQGSRFGRQGTREFVVRPGSAEDFQEFMGDLRSSNNLPNVVMHLWNIDPDAPPTLQIARDRSLHSLIALAQSLGTHALSTHHCHIGVVSSGLHEVTGEEPLDPTKNLLLGPVTVIPQEYSNLSCSSIDVDLSWRYRDQQIASLLADTAQPSGSTPIAYRGVHRWRQVFEAVRLPVGATPVRAGGTYLITGGTGGVGLALAEQLAAAAPGVKLALVSRSPREAGEDLHRLRECGAHVTMLQADVGDLAQLQEAVHFIEREIGAINGVIHAAGVAGGSTIETKTREIAEADLAAKVSGCLMLEEVLGCTPLDFVVLCSSLTALTGGVGQVVYTAANAFLDAFVVSRNSHKVWRRVVAVDWDRWHNVGMAAITEPRWREPTREYDRESMLRSEGMEVFSRVLASAGESRVVVSTCELTGLIEKSRAYQLDVLDSHKPLPSLHARPLLAGKFKPPENETEFAIAAVWQEELGIERVGRSDDFFQLGGDSLIAIRLMSRLRNMLRVPLAMRTLYEMSTISALAEHVASVRWLVEGDKSLQLAQDNEEGVL